MRQNAQATCLLLDLIPLWTSDFRVDLCSAAEAECHPPIGVNGHLINDGQPELLVKLGEDIQFLHLEHERTNGFCLGFPCGLRGAELLKLHFCFFVPLHKAVVPGGIFLLVLRRLRVFRNAAPGQFGHHIDLREQALDLRVDARAIRQRGLHQAAVGKDAALAVEDSVEGIHKPRLDGFLVQVGRFTPVAALEFVVALPDDPAVFAVGAPHLGPIKGAAVAADDA